MGSGTRLVLYLLYIAAGLSWRTAFTSPAPFATFRLPSLRAITSITPCSRLYLPTSRVRKEGEAKRKETYTADWQSSYLKKAFKRAPRLSQLRRISIRPVTRLSPGSGRQYFYKATTICLSGCPTRLPRPPIPCRRLRSLQPRRGSKTITRTMRMVPVAHRTCLPRRSSPW